MANNFKPWVDTPTPGQQVQSASVFASDEQRIDGFKAGDPASALRVNSALRQANVVIAGLMQFCDEVKTLPADLSLLSTVTQVKNAIKDSIETLHNTTLTSAKDYTDTRETAINTQISSVQTQVTGNKNDIATLFRRVSYDIVIRTQAEFEALIKSPTWLNAKSVALVGQFAYDEPNNSGIKIPATVKQIHGFNSAKITITNFVHNTLTAKAGLWYDTAPTTPDYSIRDLEVDCTGTAGYGFYNCTNLTNCTGTGTGTASGSSGFGFRNCTNLTNCTGTGTGPIGGYGFSTCTNLSNCVGTGTGTRGYGFSYCTSLTNCIGTGTGTGDEGCGFYYIKYASNCKDGGSSTAMWGGINKNINLETCRKTPVDADNTDLNT